MSNVRRVLYFGTDNCTQCRAMKEQMKLITHEQCTDYDRYDIMTVPTLILVEEDGSEVKRLTGFHTAKQVADWIMGN
jgi:thiol:disulfide interchange protein